MEKLILTCGRYIPSAAGDADTRVAAMEAYLARLSEELEVLMGEMDRVLTALEGLLPSAASSADTNGEGGA
jgi:hypothetical protein